MYRRVLSIIVRWFMFRWIDETQKQIHKLLPLLTILAGDWVHSKLSRRWCQCVELILRIEQNHQAPWCARDMAPSQRGLLDIDFQSFFFFCMRSIWIKAVLRALLLDMSVNRYDDPRHDNQRKSVMCSVDSQAKQCYYKESFVFICVDPGVWSCLTRRRSPRYRQVGDMVFSNWAVRLMQCKYREGIGSNGL